MTVNRRRDGKQAKRFHINGSRGFTLIELLVVISIISLLSSIVLASLTSARASARDSERVQTMRSIKTALELYRSDHGEYIQTDGVWKADCNGSGSSDFSAILQPLVGGEYIPEISAEPSPSQNYPLCYYYRTPGYKINTDTPYCGDDTDADYILMFGVENSSFNLPTYIYSNKVYCFTP